jgi:hypothetical protein
MNNSVPSYLTFYVMTGSIAALAMLLFGLHRALRRTAWPQKERAKAFWSLSALLVGWFIFALVTSLAGWYGGVARRLPTIQYGLLTPIIVGVLLFWTWPLLRSTLAVVPNEWIVGIQFYRILGVIFLILYASGRLPALFALPAGVGDVFVGLLAPVVAIAYARLSDRAARRVRIWNLFGIADLVVAVSMGFLTSPSPLQVASFDRPNLLISIFPLSLIPVYMVPLSVLLHFASLHHLRHAEIGGTAGSFNKSSTVENVKLASSAD